MIRSRDHIADIAPYALADLEVSRGVQAISLAQNESACSPSPRALAAASEAAVDGALYPDPEWKDLRAAIADVHGLDAGSILCGAGSMELIGALIRAYAGPGDTVLSTQYAYAFFQTATQLTGANYVAAAEQEFTVSVDALLESVTPMTKIVCVANPGNPTGTRVSYSELARLRAGLPPDALLMIDEAYGEFSDDGEAAPCQLSNRDDTVILRTFSKAYALAGMRVGWGIFPTPIAAELRKVLNPNNVSAVSQAAAAAAMRDQDHMRAIVAETAGRRAAFAHRLGEIGIETVPSETNFLLLCFSGAAEAKSVDDALRSQGVLMRAMGTYGLVQCLRATIGTQQQMDNATAVLAAWTAKERSA